MMLHPLAVAWILVVHYIADFLCQPHEIAIGKSTSNVKLAQHVVLYYVVLSILSGPLFDHTAVWARFALFNIAVHAATDYVTSRWASRYWRQQKVRPFFLVIGLDQLAHTVTLVLSLSYFRQ